MKAIHIFGHTFHPIKSNEIIWSKFYNLYRESFSLAVDEPDKILDYLQHASEEINSLFGRNILYDIFKDKPVSILDILKIMNIILNQTNEDYRNYIREEYINENF